MVETAGKVHQNPGGVRVYFKPAIGKAVWRKSGVNRQSAAVIRRNEAFASAMTGAGGCPATAEEFRGKTSLQGSGHAQEARTLALEQASQENTAGGSTSTSRHRGSLLLQQQPKREASQALQSRD